MILYADASALVKRYVAERGSRDVIDLTGGAEIVATSLISRAEVSAALAHATRLGVLSQKTAEGRSAGSRASGQILREYP